MFKNYSTTFILVVLFGCMLLFESCKKSSNDGAVLPAGAQKIVSDDILNSLKSKGFAINEGLTPPNVEGIYLISPQSLSASTISSDVVGAVYNDQKIRLSKQNNSDFSLLLDWKETHSNGNGLGGFISGNGTKFSIFFETIGTGYGIPFKDLRIYSGEMTSAGIANLQWAYYMKEKGSDPDGDLVEVGTIRVINDSDKLSKNASSYRLGADNTEDSQVKTSLVDSFKKR